MSRQSENIGVKSTTYVNLAYGEKTGVTANKAQSREKQIRQLMDFFKCKVCDLSGTNVTDERRVAFACPPRCWAPSEKCPPNAKNF